MDTLNARPLEVATPMEFLEFQVRMRLSGEKVWSPPRRCSLTMPHSYILEWGIRRIPSKESLAYLSAITNTGPEKVL